VQHHLGIGLRAKAIAALDQFAAQSAIVVDLAVVHDPPIAVGIRHRHPAGLAQIDDAETIGAEASLTQASHAFLVGTPMALKLAHLRDHLRVVVRMMIRSRTDQPGNPTHDQPLLSLAQLAGEHDRKVLPPDFTGDDQHRHINRQPAPRQSAWPRRRERPLAVRSSNTRTERIGAIRPWPDAPKTWPMRPSRILSASQHSPAGLRWLSLWKASWPPPPQSAA
jgi:hypothetical protein